MQDQPSNQSSSGAGAGEVPPSAVMLDLITGYWVSQALLAVTQLGIADRLGADEKTAEELARTSGVDASALHRIMRALASKGVFSERPGARYALTPLGATLRTGVPGSMKNFARMMIDGYNWRAWQELGYSLETGKNAFERVHGQPVFSFLAGRPDEAKMFGDSMSDLSAVETPAVVEAYDFSPFVRLVDVGGGHGVLLTSILKACPNLSGVLYDNAHVIENARRDSPVNDPAIAARIELVSGDFFQSIPTGADCHVMKYILHDWDDAQALRILQSSRRALRRGGKVLVVDTVVRSGVDNSWSKWLDINMLVCVGGKERTAEEFEVLFRKAGFHLMRVVPTRCPLSVIEGLAVGG